jgi:hypothetical protein
MGIEEAEQVQTKGICDIFNKILAKIFQNLKKELSIQVQEPGHQAGLTKIETPHSILSLKQQAQRKEKDY